MSIPNSGSQRGLQAALMLLVLPHQPLALASLPPAHTHPAPAPAVLARGGGFGGGGGFGRGGGGFGAGRSGFQGGYGDGGFGRGATRPTGGWASGIGERAPDPGLDGGFGRGGFPSGGADRGGAGWSGGAWSGDRGTGSFAERGFAGDASRTTSINASWNRTVDLNSLNLSPGWARPGWGYARPWTTGWYGGWATPSWGWWAGSAALWGVSSLASAAIINGAVNAAVNSGSTLILVPNSGYQLLFGTVQPSGSQGVTFVAEAGGVPYSLSADCVLGTLNGAYPANAAQAELLNAACQVAFGSTG